MKKTISLLVFAISSLFASSQTTQISTPYCAHTATSNTEFIWADSIGTPSINNNGRYNFKLVNGATTLTWTTNNEWPIMQWYLINGFSYSTTYTASVAYSNDYGVTFGAYGSTCTIISSANPTTQLSTGSCNSSPASNSTLLYADIVVGATQYEYRLINSALSYTQNYVKPQANFILSQFTGLQTNTNYSVNVRPYINNTWGSYGPTCNVTTPGAPTTSIISTDCGVTASSYTSQLFRSESVPNFDCYFYNFTDGVTTYTLEKCNNNNFILSQLTPALPVGTTFTVTVKVKYNGVYGAFGNPCTITTPAAYMRIIKDVNGKIYDIEIENLDPGFYIINENGNRRKIIKQ